MKIKMGFTLVIAVLMSCSGKVKNNMANMSQIPLAGTWKLIVGMVIEKGDTVVTNYNKNISFIKIINDTHFAFLQHDPVKGKDKDSLFAAGGGSYTLNDSLYTEHLEYCSDRNWENNDFKFIINIKNDTLLQRGVEKVEGTGVNRINIEKYKRLIK